MIESPLKRVKNAFYFILKPLLVFKIFKFLPDLLIHVGKRLNKKAKANFKIYSITNWQTNNTYIAQYLKK